MLFWLGIIWAQTFFRFTDDAEKHKYTFDLYRNIIVIPVWLNGEGPFNFILDTGAGNCIITEPQLVNDLQLQKGREVIISGSGENTGERAFLVHQVTVRVKNMESLPLTMAAFEEDPFLLSEYLGCTIHGILGYEFFNSFIVRLNYQTQVMTVFNPITFQPNKKYTPVPITLKNKRPFLQGFCAYHPDTIIRLEDILIDTGAGFPISLETYSDEQIIVPEKNMNDELGVGLNGVIAGQIARTYRFGFSNFVFEDIVTAYPEYSSTGSKQVNEQRNGSIGNFLLNRFTVVFYYAGGIMYMKPNGKLRQHFPYDRTGVEVIATGEEYIQFLIRTVKPGSPAEEIGILPGDEIEEINFQKVTTLELSEIDHLLSNPASNSITLRIKRDNKIFYMIVEMRDLI